MAVLVDERTRLAVAGMTGREGSFHTLNNRRYGTNDVEGRKLLQEADLPNVHTARTMNEAAEMVVALAAGRGVGAPA